MSARKPVSYYGIGSCLMFATATGLILSVVVASWFASHKLAGYEIIVLGPVALLLYVVGVIFAINGLREPGDNPGSLAGLILNVLPFVLVALRVVQTTLGASGGSLPVGAR